MRALSDIVRDNRKAAELGHAIPGAVGTEQPQAEEYTPPTKAEWDAMIDVLGAKERTINIVQLTVVHDLQRGIYITGSAPYIETPDDPAIINVRNLLIKHFEQITAPPVKGQISPVWGEYTGEDEGEKPAGIRQPSEKHIQLARA